MLVAVVTQTASSSPLRNSLAAILPSRNKALTPVVKYDNIGMKEERLEMTRGSGNVFQDLRRANADIAQFKAILASEIIKVLDREGLSVRAAQARTGIAASDFSRIRNADLSRFTVDRLMAIINRLGSRVEVKIKVRRAESRRRAIA